MFKIEDWLPSAKRFMELWVVVRICPEQIDAPEQSLSVNFLTLTVSLLILLLARMSVAGSSQDISVTIIATIISVLIVFLTGYVTLIRNPGPAGVVAARKWGVFFVAVWISSLICLIALDAVPFWFGGSPFTTMLIDFAFGPDTVTPLLKDLLRAVLFGLLAMGILLYKSRRMDPAFHFFNRCALATIGVGLLMNTALMQVFIYTHFV